MCVDCLFTFIERFSYVGYTLFDYLFAGDVVSVVFHIYLISAVIISSQLILLASSVCTKSAIELYSFGVMELAERYNI